MSVLIILILVSLAVGLTFLGAFIWSVRSGQYEDTLTPSMRVLLDDPVPAHREESPQPLASSDNSPSSGGPAGRTTSPLSFLSAFPIKPIVKQSKKL